eukprot:sb/3475834/
MFVDRGCISFRSALNADYSVADTIYLYVLVGETTVQKVILISPSGDQHTHTPSVQQFNGESHTYTGRTRSLVQFPVKPSIFRFSSLFNSCSELIIQRTSKKVPSALGLSGTEVMGQNVKSRS